MAQLPKIINKIKHRKKCLLKVHGNQSRRQSRRWSISVKYFHDPGANRRESNASSSRGHGVIKDYGSSRKMSVDKEHSSDVDSDFSKEHSKVDDENFTKSFMQAQREQSIVQELDDEDNISEIL